MIWIVSLALAALAGFLAATPMAKLSARLKMPESSTAQWFLLAAIWARPYRLPFIHSLPTDAFDHPRTRALLEAMRQAANLPQEVTEQEEAARLGKQLQEDATSWRREVARLLPDQDLLDSLSDRDLWDRFATGQNLYQEGSDKKAMAALDKVTAAYQERFVSPVHAEFLFTPSEQHTPIDPGSWSRVQPKVTLTRRLISALAAVVYVATIPFLLEVVTSPLLAAAAWLVTGAGLIIISFVDHDTMSLHIKTWVLTLVAAWSLTIAANFQHPSWLLAGFFSALVVVILFEVLNRLFFILRGVHGQGFGDTLIVMVSVGIPAALTGSWMAGYLSLMSALVAAIIYYLLRKAFTASTKEEPFAFGPWLAVGPPAALLLTALLPALS